MTLTPKLYDDGNGALIVAHDGGVLFRYVYESGAPSNESPRPYVHPLCSLAGDVLTNFRPNDHPWHHGLSLTLTSVDGVNFWGGPTHKSADGYAFRDDHGTQRHREWLRREPAHIVHTLDWIEQKSKRVLLNETRTLRIQINNDTQTWSLQWTSALKNTTSQTLTLGNYHALSGLKGSHYTGLQFRGARGLLDEHGDATIDVVAEGGFAGEKSVHEASAQWAEWRTQHDGTLHRTLVRFENLTGPIHWFVRRNNPLIAFPFHYDQPLALSSGRTLTLDHRLTFSKI